MGAGRLGDWQSAFLDHQPLAHGAAVEATLSLGDLDDALLLFSGAGGQQLWAWSTLSLLITSAHACLLVTAAGQGVAGRPSAGVSTDHENGWDLVVSLVVADTPLESDRLCHWGSDCCGPGDLALDRVAALAGLCGGGATLGDLAGAVCYTLFLRK